MYTKNQFGQELIRELGKGYDVEKISAWANHIFFVHQRELEKGLEELLMPILMMEMGSEFELSELELLQLVETLIGNKV